MRNGIVAGVICGALVGLILVAVILKWMRGDGSKKCKFDERQELVRGTSFKYGFFALIIYNGAYILATMALEKLPFDTATGMFFGICFGVMVFAAYGIWHDGYLALNEKPVRVLIAFALIGIINLALGIRSFVAGDAFVDGQLTFRSINLFCGLLFVFIGVVYLLKWIKDVREGD